jgi:hypothetical protein
LDGDLANEIGQLYLGHWGPFYLNHALAEEHENLQTLQPYPLLPEHETGLGDGFQMEVEELQRRLESRLLLI